MNLFDKWPLNDCNKNISISQDWRKIFFLEIQMNGFDLMSGEAYESRFA